MNLNSLNGMESTEAKQEVFLHGIEYIITLNTYSDSLRISVEEKLTGNTWKADFTAKYIEDIAQKTGTFQSFGNFSKLVLAALRQDNESIYIDVLTPRDLELLKSRKGGSNNSFLSASSQSLSRSIVRTEKRYVIVTLIKDNDRVHYPLPLSYDENPEPEMMRNTISRLAVELERIKSRTVMSESGIGTPKSIKSTKSVFTVPNDITEENEMLKRRLEFLESKRIGGAVEMDCLSKEIIEKESIYEKNLRNTDKELETIKGKLSQAEKEIEETKSELFKTKIELGRFDKDKDYTEVKTLREELNNLSNSLEFERKESITKIEANKKLMNSTVQEISKLLEGEKTLKARITQLERDLERTIKRPTYTPTRSYNNKYSPNNNATPNRYHSPSTNNYNNYKRGNSVPSNRNNSNKRTTPTYTNNYTRPQPQRNNFRPHYSPASSVKSNSTNKSKNSAASKNYSPNNRLYSPNGAPRVNNRINNGRTKGAVDRVSPMRPLINQKPRVPPAVGYGYKRQSPVVNKTSNTSTNRMSVFDRLSGGSGASRQPAKPINNEVRKPISSSTAVQPLKPTNNVNFIINSIGSD